MRTEPADQPAKRSRLRENILSLSALQAASYLLPLLTVPYLVRVLGAEKFGMIAFAQAFIHYFATLADYGFYLSANRDIARNRHDPSAVAAIFSSVLVAKAGLALLGFAVFALLLVAVPIFRADWPLFLIGYITVVGTVITPQWLFQGMERMRPLVVIAIAARVAGVVGIFALVHAPADYRWALAIQSGGGILASVAALVYAVRVLGVRWQPPGMQAVRARLADGWHLFVSTAAVSLYTSTNVFVLGLVGGPVAAGHFSAAYKLVQATLRMLTPVTQSIYPHVNALASRSQDDALRFIRMSLGRIAFGSLLLSLGLFVLAEPVVMLLYGRGFESTVVALKWMSPLPLVIAVGTVLGEHTMLTFGMQREFSRILVKAGVLNLMLVIPLAFWLGATGAAAASLLIELAIVAARVVALNSRGFTPWSLRRGYA